MRSLGLTLTVALVLGVGAGWLARQRPPERVPPVRPDAEVPEQTTTQRPPSAERPAATGVRSEPAATRPPRDLPAGPGPGTSRYHELAVFVHDLLTAVDDPQAAAHALWSVLAERALEERNLATACATLRELLAALHEPARRPLHSLLTGVELPPAWRVELLERLAVEVPDHPHVLAELGIAYAAAGSRGRAAEALAQAFGPHTRSEAIELLVELDPHRAVALLEASGTHPAILARAYERAGYTARAVELYPRLDRLLDVERLAPERAEELLLTKVQRGETNADLADDMGYRLLMAQAYLEPPLYRRDDAGRIFLEAIRVDVDNDFHPGAWTAHPRPRIPLTAAQQAVELRPDNPGLWEYLGIRYLETGSVDGARAAWTRALRGHLAAYDYDATERPVRVETTLHRLAELDPDYTLQLVGQLAREHAKDPAIVDYCQRVQANFGQWRRERGR